MALALAKHAETSLSQFYAKPKAIDALGNLYHSTFTTLAQSHRGSGSTSALETEAQSILDIAVQKVAEQLSWRLLTEPGATPLSIGVPALLDLCIDGVVKKYLLLSAAYKVLEDLMEGQTIKTCEKLWDLLEERKEKLSTREFIPDSGRTNKASLCLLRMCNALLRRVSKTHNSVFCGRILVFLSFVFTLSERSAVNLPGRSNMGNLTMFEDEEAFDAGEAMDLAQSSSNAIVPSAVELDKERDVEATPIDYNLYRTFWDLQRFCRDHHLATKTVEDWEKFFEEINSVLSAFEGNAFSPDDLERSRDLKHASAMDEATSAEHHFFQPKYLTNSRLFRLQLRDPILRECMLTQFLILLHHLYKTKAPDGCTTPKSKCLELQERVLKLLRETPSDGKGFSEMLTMVLERERNWTKWKMDKCPPYERFPPQEVVKDNEVVEEPPKKRRLGDTIGLSDRPLSKRASTKHDVGGDPVLMEQILSAGSKPSSVILEKIKAADRLTQVPMSSYITRFQEAWDPENGIEEAYWPDKDKMFCWRTLRMVMKTNVDQMHHAVDGANAVIRGILGMTTDMSKPPLATTTDRKEMEGSEELLNEKHADVGEEVGDTRGNDVEPIKKEEP